MSADISSLTAWLACDCTRGDGQHWEGEPCPDQFEKEAHRAQLLLRLLPPAGAWQLGSGSAPSRGLLEEMLPHPVNPRVELVREFREL